MKTPICRFCGNTLQRTFANLGMSPPSNAFLSAVELGQLERFYPLHAYVCESCLLVQLEEFETPAEIFTDYAYFSSFSSSWLEHSEHFATRIVKRLGLDEKSLVIEIASNDGYLLQYFKKQGIRTLGIEPAVNVARAAQERGITTITEFFGSQVATALVDDGEQPDLICANNVLAHVPNINDFVSGIKILLKTNGTATFEFPHLLKLIEFNQFDTIYHEHFSYFSLLTAVNIFRFHDLEVVDVDELPTHGGSLRLFVRHSGQATPSENVARILANEREANLEHVETYSMFSGQVEASKRTLLKFLIDAKNAGKRIAAYGAAAKATTLLNYCGIRTDFIDYIVDRNPYKQNRYLPGCHIPILDPAAIARSEPDYILILPWNLKEEITKQLAYVERWGARFVVPIPRVEVL